MADMHSTDPSNGGLTLAIIGCGTMGSAILAGVIKSFTRTQSAGTEPRIKHFIATVNSLESEEALRTRFMESQDRLEVLHSDNASAMRSADIILLACKPYMADTVLKAEGVREAVEGKLIISVLVGSPVAKLESAIYHSGLRKKSEKPVYIKRVMLNIAAELGESMSVIEVTSMPKHMEEITDWIFLQVGKTAAVAPENFDIAGVTAGVSSAFLSVALDGILDGAVSQGLKRADARKMVTQSLLSLARLLENGEHPAVLRERCASPKGTTIDGLLSLEEDRARYAFSKAVIASSKRSHEIGN
ncbi:6-phosphogluconate dehydrogenase C-terminal [Venustampulla echinocandica]|uniref:6-phosphogluconate dehydrogenase C-terminal n=1 Tax=Venustampulla echinocandica TaxID=2656787 RepID=A0A370TR22_9HELO|nr:6-phosphogluconate dehydrogenase C-terminal [Venustampulla echinocandica]RDL37971.1 6-phosphogluconate dehydrogenase C-terminal [Venustampulla echinocandica]